MKLAHIVLLAGAVILTVIFFPITITEPYNTIEIYEEKYIVVEPRVVLVADWVSENVTVDKSFVEKRYSQKDLDHDVSLSKCSDSLSYSKINLAIPEWGKINIINRGNDAYFAGYVKGIFTRKDVNTFDVGAKKGHLYRIIQNEKVNITLKQGEYLPLALGYSIQVNNINNVKSFKRTCSNTGGHYVPENGDDIDSWTGGCTTTTEYHNGALMTLQDVSIVKQWDVRNGSTLIYEKSLSGGETVPMIAVHVKEITNLTVSVDAIFQISKDYVSIPEGLGAEIVVNIKNTDSQPGTFNVYTGFIINNSLGFEIGKSNTVFLNPSESRSVVYTTDKDTEGCRYYSQGASKKSVSENFTGIREVNSTKRRTEYRNVTLYVDVIKTRFLERNVTKFRNRTVYGWARSPSYP